MAPSRAVTRGAHQGMARTVRPAQHSRLHLREIHQQIGGPQCRVYVSTTVETPLPPPHSSTGEPAPARTFCLPPARRPPRSVPGHRSVKKTTPSCPSAGRTRARSRYLVETLARAFGDEQAAVAGGVREVALEVCEQLVPPVRISVRFGQPIHPGRLRCSSVTYVK